MQGKLNTLVTLLSENEAPPLVNEPLEELTGKHVKNLLNNNPIVYLDRRILKYRWSKIDDAFNSDKLIEFLEALTKDSGRKGFLILDNLRVHHGKPVKAWTADQLRKDRVILFAQL